MAKNVTLAQLLADVRALYEIRSISLDDALLTRWINQSLAFLHDTIASVAPDYFNSSYDLAVVANTQTYDLSSVCSDFYRGHGADVLLSSGEWSPLRQFPWEERHLYAKLTVTQADQLYRYMGKYLFLAPTPSWSGTIRIWYIPTATVLVGGTTPNSADLMNGWDEFIVFDVALKCAIKEEAPTSALDKRRAELLEAIKGFAPQRDFSHHDRVRDANVQARVTLDPFARLPWPP